MIINNYICIIASKFSKKIGRGKYFRKKVFSTKRILEKNFLSDTSFSFVQIGANDGISFDFLYFFVTNRRSTGILVEPVKEYFDELCSNYLDYPAILKVNKAVHRTEKNAVIYKIENSKRNLYPDWVKGIASFDKSNLTKFDILQEEHIVEELVEAETLMNIINEREFKNFDYLQIDTEGYDFKIVEMFDFSKFKPSIIKAEFINLSDEEKLKMKKRLVSNGYFVFFEGLDIVGVDLGKIRL